MHQDPDLAVVERLGIDKVAQALSITPQAVGKWRSKGRVPDDRRRQIRRLAHVNGGERSKPVSQPTSDEPSAKPDHETRRPLVINAGSGKRLPGSVDLNALTGAHASAEAEAAIAERAVALAGICAADAAARAPGLPPVLPVRWYKTRLAALFALDFPVLTMAFVGVAEISPIIAAGSAIALSLFLVLGAHALGQPLRAMADRLAPIWRHAIALAVMLGLLVAVVYVTLVLRVQGFELDETRLTSGARQSLIFGADSETILPASFQRAIVQAAALVAIGSAVFGMAWSFQHHGPQTDWARAEAAYRKNLCQLARTRARSDRAKRGATKAIVAVLLATSLLGSTIDASRATTCTGTTVLALIDTTTAYDDIDRALIMPAIDQMARSLETDQRLILRTIRDGPSSSRLLFDGCVPPEPTLEWSLRGVLAWLTNNPSALRAERTAFFVSVRDALLSVLHQNGEAPRTALVETLNHVTADTERLATVWLFSDLLESSIISTEGLLGGHQDPLLNATAELPSLTAVEVHVAGVGRLHDKARRPLTSREYGALIDAWTSLVGAAGGEINIHG